MVEYVDNIFIFVFKVILYNANYIKGESVKILPTNLTQEEQIIGYLKKNKIYFIIYK